MKTPQKRFGASKAFIVGLATALVVITAGVVSAPRALAACDKVSIVYCGLQGNSVQGYIDYIRGTLATGSDGRFNDMGAMLNYGGFSSSVIASMNTSNTKIGTLTSSNNKITVDGKVVATDAWMSARFTNGAGFVQVKDGVWARQPSTNAAKSSYQVLVVFDGNGKAVAATVIECGNMLSFTPVIPTPKPTPVYSCDSLDVTKLTATNVRATVAYTAKNGPTPVSYDFDWGDGSAENWNGATRDHTYAKSGTYTITSRVNMSLNGSTVTAESSACKKQITVDIPVNKALSCDSLTVANTADPYTFNFTAKATPTNTSITNYKFDWGDNTSRNVSSTATSVTEKYTFAPGKNYNVKVYVTGKDHANITSTACAKTVTIPLYECVQLTSIKPENLKYTFTAEAKTANGATLVSADFDFGDGSTAVGVQPNGSNVVTEHTYAKAGSYSVLATLKFNVDGKEVTAPTCRAAVTPNAPAIPECKPGIPVGDVRCNPCPYDASVPAGDVRCVAPPEQLPNTGSGNIAALGLAAIVGGFLFYRQRMFTAHKKDFQAADAGQTLPLADPMAESVIDSTPVNEPVRSTFRRRRQF